MIRKYLFTYAVNVLAIFLFTSTVQASQIEVAGKHTRADGSIYDFAVVDGDALSPGDRFQIIIDADKKTYYAVLYISRDGKAAQIFPQAGKRGVIRAGARQYVPGRDNYFTLDINGGRELMFVVTSPNVLSNLKSVLRGAEALTSPAEIHAYLQKRLSHVKKLEITNTGKHIASTTDQISSSLVRDIERTYAKNPWPNIPESQTYNKERVRRGNDNSIPEEVRRRTAEVRSLLKRPKGTTDSSSLRTVQTAPSETTSAPAEGTIRRDSAAMLMAQKEEQAEQTRMRQERLAEEKRLRQQQIAMAEQERQAAEAEARRLQEEREAAERLEAQRIAEAEAVARKLALQQQAMAEAEAEAKRLQEEREEQERLLAEQLEEEERQERIRAEKEQKRLAAEKAGAERLEAERIAQQRAREEAARLAEEQAEAARIRQAEEEAARLLAEEAERKAEEARRQAEIAAEDKRLRAEQQALEEKLRQQQLAEQVKDADAKEEDKGIFGRMFALVSGDSAETSTDDNTVTVVQTHSTGEVILNEPAANTQVEFENSNAEAPREAVVALQAPSRPTVKKMTAPAPERIKLEEGKSTNTTGDMVGQIASAIVSIRTSNDPQASGFILDSKGHILTAWHVINGVDDIDVSFMAVSGAPRAYKARVVKYDKFHDLALLKLINPPEGIQPITVSADGLPDAGSTVRVFGQKDGQVWATDNAVITRIAPHFTWFSRDNVIHRGEVMQVDLPPEGKDIGSLVTTMDYQMLGVKSFSGSQTGRTYAVSVRMIRDFVEAPGVAASKR